MAIDDNIKSNWTTKQVLESGQLNKNFSIVKGADTKKLFVINEQPAYSGSPGIFNTAFPIRTGTTVVTVRVATTPVSTRRLRLTTDYTESGASQITITDPAALTDPTQIIVDYLRGDV
jgi:hypothetical protein